MEEKNASGGRPRRGRSKMRKNYRHKYFDWSKKVVTGQSQNTQKSCFKSPTQNAKKDILGHVAIRCHLSNILRGWGIIAIYTKVWRYIVWIFSIFKRNILAEKWSNVGIWPFLAQDFWNGMEWNGILPFSNGLFLAEKWSNAVSWSIQARTFGIEWIFRSNFKYNIADYYIINRTLRENGRVEFFNDNC